MELGCVPERGGWICVAMELGCVPVRRGQICGAGLCSFTAVLLWSCVATGQWSLAMYL